MENDSRDVVSVALKDSDTTFGVVVPNADSLVIGAGDEEGAVRAPVEIDAINALVMATVSHRVIRLHGHCTGSS